MGTPHYAHAGAGPECTLEFVILSIPKDPEKSDEVEPTKANCADHLCWSPWLTEPRLALTNRQCVNVLPGSFGTRTQDGLSDQVIEMPVRWRGSSVPFDADCQANGFVPAVVLGLLQRTSLDSDVVYS